MTTPRPLRADWRASFAALREYLAVNGALPSHTSNPRLYAWVSSQRSLFRRGILGADKERLLKEVPGLLVIKPRQVESLSYFVATRGRLPSSTAADPHERTMGRYLVYSLRPMIRTGSVAPATLAAAQRIPGVIDGNRRPDQNAALDELRQYIADRGHLPPSGENASPDEYRIARWFRNNIKGNRETKTPALRERHDALAGIVAGVPSKTEFTAAQRILTLEKECSANGWKPAGHDAWLQERFERTSDEILRARITRILEYPTLRDYSWLQDLQQLIEYEAVNGRLPRSWNDGHLYSWLATQRRRHSSGTLAEWKTERLAAVYGALPAGRRAA